jgi:hypothetical protein
MAEDASAASAAIAETGATLTPAAQAALDKAAAGRKSKVAGPSAADSSLAAGATASVQERRVDASTPGNVMTLETNGVSIKIETK